MVNPVKYIIMVYLKKNEPIAIEIIDTKENIEKILPVLKNILQELNTGLITLEEVEIVR